MPPLWLILSLSANLRLLCPASLSGFIAARQPQALTSCIRSDFRCQPHQRSDVRFPFKIIFNLHLNSNAPYKSLARWVYPMRYGKCGNLCGKCGNFYSAPRNEYGCRSEWTLRKAECTLLQAYKCDSFLVGSTSPFGHTAASCITL